VIGVLLRGNANFRWLWFGQSVSQLGDWFNSVALYALLFSLTGSATAVAWMMVVQLLPVAIVGPWAGVIVDRYDRRKIMIAADLVRAVAVLGPLFVHSADMVWLAYVCTAIAVSASGFFEPARSATIPAIVPRPHLVAANAVSTATWSAMLAIGAAAGGGVAAAFGRDIAFLINSASFVVSAVFIRQIHMPRDGATTGSGGWQGVMDGVRYMRTHGDVAWIALVKGGWAIAGGALLLLTVFGDRVFSTPGQGDAGIGLLFGARGIGAVTGSIIVTTLANRSRAPVARSERPRRCLVKTLPNTSEVFRLTPWIGPSYVAAGVCYATLSVAPSIWVAAAGVIAAHTFGSILWVSSNVLLQVHVPAEFRGRVFAAELMAIAIVQSAISAMTAYALDDLHASPRLLIALVGAAFCVPAGVWYLVARRVVMPERA